MEHIAHEPESSRSSAGTRAQGGIAAIEAEQSVLGALMLAMDDHRASLVDDVSQIVRPEDFYLERHQLIYRVIQQQVAEGQPFDAVILAEKLAEVGTLERAGGPEHLGRIMETVPHTGHARYYAGIVADRAARRRLVHAARHAIEQAHNESRPTDEVLAEAEGQLHELLESQAGHRGDLDLGAILVETLERLQTGQTAGLPTGYPDLEQITGGWHAGTLTILAARPSMGKTALALNLVHRVCAAAGGAPALILSLEQSRLELAERLLSLESGVSTHRLRSGDLSDQETQQVLQASTVLSALPLSIDDEPRQTVSRIAVQSRIHRRRHGLGLVVIDYLQLITPRDRRVPREQQVAEIARELKALARDLEVPVIALAQLNRLVETRGDKRPQLSDLRESGSIEQDADLVMFVHREGYFDEQADPTAAELIVRKHRNGPTGIVHLHWAKDTMRFEPSAMPHQTAGYESHGGGGDMFDGDF